MTYPALSTTTETVERLPMKWSRPFADEWWRWLLVGALFVVVSIGALIISLVMAIYMSAGSDRTEPVDAIVVMGAAQFNGVPSAVLQARLDTTYRVWEEGLAPWIIVTGGKVPGDNYTESEASRNYLVELGVPESAILLENEGSNSSDSLAGAARLARQHSIEDVVIVSDGFHLFRSRMIAEDNDLNAYGIPSDDSPIEHRSSTEFEYVLREAAAVMAYVVD